MGIANQIFTSAQAPKYFAISINLLIYLSIYLLEINRSAICLRRQKSGANLARTYVRKDCQRDSMSAFLASASSPWHPLPPIAVGAGLHGLRDAPGRCGFGQTNNGHENRKWKLRSLHLFPWSQLRFCSSVLQVIVTLSKFSYHHVAPSLLGAAGTNPWITRYIWCSHRSLVVTGQPPWVWLLNWSANTSIYSYY